MAIDDVGINLVAVSKHFDDADDARVRAILARTLEEDSCRYLFSFGIVATRDKIVRIPECRELGFKERSCYPIRWQERTLGYLWLVGKVSPAEDKAAVACAGELAVPMFSMQLEGEQAFSKHELILSLIHIWVALYPTAQEVTACAASTRASPFMAERLFYQKLNKEEQQIIEEEYHLRLLSLERRREYMGMPVEAHA